MNEFLEEKSGTSGKKMSSEMKKQFYLGYEVVNSF
jgi:hypothetical protein